MNESSEKKKPIRQMLGRMFGRKSGSSSNPSEENDNDEKEASVKITRTIEVFEHERWRDKIGWSSRNLDIGDPKRYWSSLGQTDTFVGARIEDGWTPDGDWRVDTGFPRSDEGWLYGVDFRTIDSPAEVPQEYRRVRRKRWIRTIIYTGDPTTSSESGKHKSVGGGVGVGAEGEDVFEMYSDEDKDDEEEESGILNAIGQKVGITASSSAEFPMRVIRDPALIAIGKEMKAIESESKREDEQEVKEWTKSIKPGLKVQVEELSRVAEDILARIEPEAYKGLSHISELQAQHKAYVESCEDVKKRLLLPRSRYIVGSGLYIGVDDIWLEQTSGLFTLEIVPHKEFPQINVVFAGTESTSSPESGLSIRVRFDGFKTRGDKTSKFPKMNVEKFKVTATIRIVIQMVFDVSKMTWVTKTFKIDLLSFRGPYGTRRSIMAAYIGVITPGLRQSVLDALPRELGVLIRTLPSPISVRGKFEMRGTNIKVLSRAMHKDSYLCELMRCTPQQLYVFQNIQKSLERGKPMTTLSEILAYRAIGVRYPKRWDQLRELWAKAERLYFEKLSEETPGGCPPAGLTDIFERLIQVSEDMLRKPLDLLFTLEHLEGQLNVQELLRCMQQYLHRTTSELGTDGRMTLTKLLMEKIHKDFRSAEAAMRAVSENLDFIQLRLQMSLHSGPKGRASFSVSDLIAQAPVVKHMFLSKAMNTGYIPPVPFLISTKPLESGDVHFELNHLGSSELLSASKYLDWEEKYRERRAAGSLLPGDDPDDDFDVQGMDILGRKYSFEDAEANAIRRRGAFFMPDSFQESVKATSGPPGSEFVSTGDLDEMLDPEKSATPYNRLLFAAGMDSNRKLLEETFRRGPRGPDSVHNVARAVASRPHLCMLVDQAVSLKPGSELFTIAVGPRDENWKPFFREDRQRQTSTTQRSASRSSASAGHHTDANSGQSGQDEGSLGNDSNRPSGLPVIIQTGQYVKIFAEVPAAFIVVKLDSLLRFFAAFFDDLTALKNYLERGFVEYEEQLLVGRVIIERLAKYLLLPGLDFNLNIDGKIVALNNELMVRVETPIKFDSEGQSTDGLNAASNRNGEPVEEHFRVLSVLKMRLRVNLMDLLEDSKAIELSVQMAGLGAATKSNESSGNAKIELPNRSLSSMSINRSNHGTPADAAAKAQLASRIQGVSSSSSMQFHTPFMAK